MSPSLVDSRQGETPHLQIKDCECNIIMLRKVCLDVVEAEIFQCCIFTLRKRKGLQLTLTNRTSVELTTHHALIPCFLQGELSEGTSVLYHYLSTEPKKLMLIGPFDNNLAKAVAAYAGLPEIGILQVKFLNFLLHNLVSLYHYN